MIYLHLFLPALGANDLMLAALWGSIICGFGLGLVFRAGGNTGGTDIIAQAVSKRFGIPSGTAIIYCRYSHLLLRLFRSSR